MLVLGIWLGLFVILIILSGLRVPTVRLSVFEIKRLGDEEKLTQLRQVNIIEGCRVVLVCVLWVAASLLLYVLIGWWSLPVMVAVVLVVWWLAAIRVLRRLSLRLYKRLEPKIKQGLQGKEGHKLAKLIAVDYMRRPDQKVDSLDHLLHLMDDADGVLTAEQKKVMAQVSGWHDTEVHNVMTAASSVDTVPSDEVLGPLVLDDLHKTGHVRFPVTDDGLTNTVGVLDITRLFDVSQNSTSSTARNEMDQEVVLLQDNTKLPRVLAKLMHSKLQFALVTDSSGRVVGIVTVQDLLDYLFKQG